jgi:hypothetical protein
MGGLRRHGHEDLDGLVRPGLAYGLGDDVEEVTRVVRLLLPRPDRHDAHGVGLLQPVYLREVAHEGAQWLQEGLRPPAGREPPRPVLRAPHAPYIASRACVSSDQDTDVPVIVQDHRP